MRRRQNLWLLWTSKTELCKRADCSFKWNLIPGRTWHLSACLTRSWYNFFRYIFWTDYGDNPKIERATLAGQERTTIIANTIIASLKYPNDVIVDYSSNRIYWVDAGVNIIGTADLKGRNIKISESIGNSHRFALHFIITRSTSRIRRWMQSP